MKKRNLVMVLVFAIVMGVFADEKGEAIFDLTDNLKSADDNYSEAEMILIDKKGNRKVRKVVMYSKDTPKGSNSFVEFLEPADVKGTKFLTIGNKKGSDEQRLYLPALKKTRLISASGKGGKFMGSDLSYYDMEERNREDYTHDWIKEETYNKMDCDVIRVKTEQEDCPYSYVDMWVNKADHFIYKLECHDKKGDALWKTIVMAEVKTIDGVIIPTKTVVDNQKDGTKTLLSMNNVRLNSGIKDEIFTVQNLEK
ncbi:MAG: outer membrane lipoprotein-sorting protein [Spirochaetales bacterium]|nr:outer membrane lipoprotein-sorting protein [Spirochaetales bacterium]